jgi:phosphopantetheine--protein transferase-like protein
MKLPIGVDILEWKKASAFYAKHRLRLGAMFSPPERRLVERSKDPERKFAMLFAAKEAAFKARGGAWMGVSGFRRIRLSERSPLRFRVAGRGSLEVKLQKERGHVIACCYSSKVPAKMKTGTR